MRKGVRVMIMRETTRLPSDVQGFRYRRSAEMSAFRGAAAARSAKGRSVVPEKQNREEGSNLGRRAGMQGLQLQRTAVPGHPRQSYRNVRPNPTRREPHC